MMDSDNRSAVMWDIGIFLLIHSMLFAGYTRLVGKDVPELMWGIPIVALSLCAFRLLRLPWEKGFGKRVSVVFLSLVLAILWFLSLPVDHLQLMEPVIEWFSDL